MSIARRTVFDNDLLHVGHVVVRPSSPVCGEIECQSANGWYCPRGRVREARRRRHHVIGTPNDAVFIAAGSPYRISYPAAIGDECLTLRFSSEALAQMLPRAVPRHGCSPAFASHVLLPPQVMLTRGLLWQCGGGKPRDPLEIEELGVDVLVAAMSALCLDDRVARRGKRSYGTTSTARRIAWCWPIS